MNLVPQLWYAARQWAQRPLILALAVLPLALAIGALTALFTVLNMSLLRPLPGIQSDTQLVEIQRIGTGGMGSISYPDFKDLAEQTQSLRDVYAYAPSPLSVRAPGEGSARNSFGFMVSSSYFDALGVRAERGRLLQSGDMRRDGEVPAAVISHEAWVRWFDSSPDVVGQSITINGAAFVLVGVSPAGFRGHIAGISPDLFLPVTRRSLLRPADGAAILDQRLSTWLLTGGRLAEGHTLADARNELNLIAQRLSAQRQALGGDQRFGLQLGVEPLQPLPGVARTGILLMVGILSLMVATLLVVACINVAGLALARAEERRAELAIRMSMGATRVQLASMMLIDALVLAVPATVIGLALAWAGLKALLAIPLPVPIPLHFDVSLDQRVVAFALLMALLTTLACGLIPALRAARSSLPGQMGRFRSTRARNVLAVVQIAATLVLLVSGGALMRALQELEDVNPGMRVEQTLAVEFDLETSGYDVDSAVPVAGRLLEAAREIPGVDDAALAAVIPLTLSSMGLGNIVGPGLPEEGLYPVANIVSPGFFQTMGMSLRGRDFDSRDTEGNPRVAIINRQLAQQLFQDADPIGRTFEYGSEEQRDPIQVIGVIEDGQYTSLGESAQSYLLLPFGQYRRAGMSLLLHTDLSVGQANAALRTVYSRLDPNLPPPQVFRLEQLAAIALLPQRIASSLMTALGALGLVLVAVGLYGLLAQFVQSHLREIGVRLALGAAPAEIARSVRWRGLRLVLVGLGLALIPALLATRLLASVIVGVSPVDLPALLLSVLIMLVIAAMACYAPARRAAATAPSEALRQS
ncbi:MAG: ABC transporter permease [Rhodanobacteraceae bacterium]|nr:ABC transporter permease [Rhodanobacteraceae bacterium]